jgi:hypothetical protein
MLWHTSSLFYIVPLCIILMIYVQCISLNVYIYYFITLHISERLKHNQDKSLTNNVREEALFYLGQLGLEKGKKVGSIDLKDQTNSKTFFGY